MQDLESVNLFACVCKTLSNYVDWNYNWNDNYKKVSLISGNKTTLGADHPAWQAEFSNNDKSFKSLVVFAINGKLGYVFEFRALVHNNVYGSNLSELLGMLKSVRFLDK